MGSRYVILYKNNMQTSWYTLVLETSQTPGTLWDYSGPEGSRRLRLPDFATVGT